MYAKKVDANQKQIVLELRQLAFSVFCTHTQGQGFPDLVIGRNGDTFLVEVKDKKGTLTPDQLLFIENWRGAPIIIARSTEEILTAIDIQLSNTHKSYIT